MCSWGRRIEPGERSDSKVVLELKALREGAYKLSRFTAYASKLTMSVSKELKALLKLSKYAHPEL